MNDDRSHRESNSFGAPEPRFDADSDIRCPFCEYDLRGLAGSQCPECGSPINWQALHQSSEPDEENPVKPKSLLRIAWEIASLYVVFYCSLLVVVLVIPFSLAIIPLYLATLVYCGSQCTEWAKSYAKYQRQTTPLLASTRRDPSTRGAVTWLLFVISAGGTLVPPIVAIANMTLSNR